MRPISKVALYLAISGSLALFFTHFFGSTEKSGMNSGKAPVPQLQPARQASPQYSGDRSLKVESPAQAVLEGGSSQTVRVKVPAIRGISNYGWVQLPRGTRVELVRENSRELLVKWDGTLVKLNPAWAAEGAVVVTKSPRG